MTRRIDFLSQDVIKAWTGTPFKRSQLQQLLDWGYKQGRDFWVRRDCSLAVKASLLHSKKPVHEVTEPDFSCFAQTSQNQ